MVDYVEGGEVGELLPGDEEERVEEVEELREEIPGGDYCDEDEHINIIMEGIEYYLNREVQKNQNMARSPIADVTNPMIIFI